MSGNSFFSPPLFSSMQGERKEGTIAIAFRRPPPSWVQEEALPSASTAGKMMKIFLPLFSDDDVGFAPCIIIVIAAALLDPTEILAKI